MGMRRDTYTGGGYNGRRSLQNNLLQAARRNAHLRSDVSQRDENKGEYMSIVNLDSVIAVVPVTNQVTAVTWYKKLLGRDADVVPVDGVAEWQLAEKAWLQVTTDRVRAGSTTVIVVVSDIDAQRNACAKANVSLGEIVEYPDIVKTFDAVDPDGNKVTFVQDLSGNAN